MFWKEELRGKSSMKIIFVTTILNGIGGIQSSLINLMSNIVLADDSIEITLCVLSNRIDTMDRIPSAVHIIPGLFDYECCIQNFKDIFFEKHSLQKKVKIVKYKILNKLFGFDYSFDKALYKFSISGQYDVAIAWSNDMFDGGKRITGGCGDVVLKKIKAKRRYAWVHNEFEELGFNRSICLSMFDNFNGIVNVSAICKRTFDSFVPEYSSKSFVVNNTVDEIQLQKARINRRIFKDNKKIHVVTVCRIKNQQKRLDRAINACQRLLQKEINDFCWYIIGDGPDLKWVKQEIEERKISDNLICLGKKEIPFDYMKTADLFVLCSQYEAFPMTLIEAITLGIPVLVTAFNSATEIVENGNNGIICENSTSGLTNALEQLLSNPDAIYKFRQNTDNSESFNAKALKQFMEVINS
ncbi:MAG: glycosyltransferase [Clostridium sp.]|nr:glycosyltransferase [Clostridium sp.]